MEESAYEVVLLRHGETVGTATVLFREHRLPMQVPAPAPWIDRTWLESFGR